MIRLRHLLVERLMNPAAATLLLLTLAFRLLVPPGLMLAPSTGMDVGEFTICTGHGALRVDNAVISGNAATQSTLRAALPLIADTLATSAQHDGHRHTGDICPFSAALAIGLATAFVVLAQWLRVAASTRIVRPADDALPTTSPARGPLGARAPPLAALA